MDTTRAREIAIELLEKHGLRTGHESAGKYWRFEWMTATRMLGQCVYNRHLIRLSLPYARMNDESQVRQTILHEIAHALCGPTTGHGRLWKATCLAIGGDGKRVVDLDDIKYPKTPYIGTCPAGHIVPRYRLPRVGLQSCVNCSPRFDIKHVITWKKNPPGSDENGTTALSR